MKHVILRPEVEWRHHRKTLFQEYLHIGRRRKKLTGCGIFVDFLERNKIQEKPPIGIETSMVYIAIPASLTVWAGLIYFVSILFF